MIGIEQWRAVIGQCQPNYTRDVETNPRPNGLRRGIFKTVSLELIALLLFAFSPESEQISLQQTIPPNDQLVCSGEKLAYTCTTDTGTLRWQEGGLGPIQYHANSVLNVSQTITQFAFELIEVDLNTNLLVSTATLLMANSSHEGIRIECADGISTFIEDVKVAEQPENCQGDVICSVSTLSEKSQFSVIYIFLNSPSPISLRCVKDYEFMLGDNVTRVNETSTSFIVDKTIGMQFMNQTVYTLDAEGRRGMVPCIFSIAEPNAIQEVTSAQSCNETMIAVSFIFDTPTFPPGNCLDLNQDIMEFFVSFSGDVSENILTQKNSFGIIVSEQAEFEISITPSLPDLGLSGSPFTSSVVVTALCEPDILLYWVVIPVVVVILAIVIVIPVSVILQCYRIQKKGLICKIFPCSEDKEKDIPLTCIPQDDSPVHSGKKDEPGLPVDELNLQELLAMEQQRVLKLQKEKDILIQEKKQTEALVADLQLKLEEYRLSGDEVNVQKLLAMEQQRVLKLQEENDILLQEKKQTEALVADLQLKLEVPLIGTSKL